jgi:uncharacterized protein YgbK (DUF1537 family)
VTTDIVALDELLARAEVVGIDLGTRRAGAVLAYLSTYAACQLSLRAGAVIYKKVDSQLRGNPGTEVAAALDAWPEAIALVTPALPREQRVVRSGQLEGPGVSPVALLEVFGSNGDRSLYPLGVAELRNGVASQGLAALTPGTIVLADAETDDDLSALVIAAWATGRAVLWAGSAGLAGALARYLATARPPSSRSRPSSWRENYVGDLLPARADQPDQGRGVLVLVASRDQLARRQLRALVAIGDVPMSEVPFSREALTRWLNVELPRLRARLGTGGTVAICSSPTDAGGPERLECAKLVVTAGLALVTAGSLAHDMLATGGETARCLLDAMGERRCTVVREIEPGMPHLRTERQGLNIVTKSGSFGTERSLVNAVEALRRWRGHGQPIAEGL